VLDKLKKEALKKAGSVVGSPAALSVLSNPTFQSALKRAINLREDVRDNWERQVETLAKSLNLVTASDVKGFKARIRELENQVATLEHDLRQERLRADKADKALSAAQAPKVPTKPAAVAAPAPKAGTKPAGDEQAAPDKAAAKPAGDAKTASNTKPAAAKAGAKTGAKTGSDKKPVAAKPASDKKPAAKKAAAKPPAKK
jgi:hypothetical protein